MQDKNVQWIDVAFRCEIMVFDLWELNPCIDLTVGKRDFS